MCDRPWETMTDADFEAMLARSVPDTPPEEIVAEVTPWRRAMNRILFGMALCAITLNFLCLNYILPAIGTVLLLLGFRALRRENRWLGGCFAVTVIRAVYFFATLVLNTTILQSAVFTPAVTTALTAVNAVLLLTLYFCFWRGLLAVQKKAGLPAQTGGAGALLAWYVLICVLAAVHYMGWIVPIAMLVGYVCILRSLFRLSRALDEAGYAIAPQPIMDRIKQYHDFNTVGAPSPLMEAAVVGLDMPDSYYKEFGAHYAHMKKLFTDGLKQIGIPFTDPQGAYFVLADIGPYMRKGESDVDFCLEMAEKVGVACVPGTSFFNENVNNIVRVHFAKKDETLYEALERLSHLKEKMG